MWNLSYKTKKKALVIKLWNQQPDLSKIEAIQYGIANEDNAINDFEAKYGKTVKCGLFVNKVRPMFAVSPDRLFNDFLIEVKCPFVLRHTTPYDLDSLSASQRSNFFCEKTFNGELRLKRKHKYYAQVQLQASTSCQHH